MSIKMSEITSVQEDKMQDVVIDPIAEKDVETSAEDEESGMLHVHTADPSLASYDDLMPFHKC